jgi:hypothetical protein
MNLTTKILHFRILWDPTRVSVDEIDNIVASIDAAVDITRCSYVWGEPIVDSQPQVWVTFDFTHPSDAIISLLEDIHRDYQHQTKIEYSAVTK